MSAAPDVTVVVCTFNRAEQLRAAVRSLLELETAERLAYEVLIVDNGSTDHTRNVAAELADGGEVPCRYVHEARPGVAAARNRGIREARGDWIAFCDDDQWADNRWLIELMLLSDERRVRVVGGAIELVDEATGQPPADVYQRLLAPGGRGRAIQPFTRRDALNSGNQMAHRSVFEEVGLYDERRTAGGEDTDWFLRMLAAGIEAWYTPRAIVRHRVPAYRFTPDYLRWLSLRQGWNRAGNDVARRGAWSAAGWALIRLGHAGLRHGLPERWARLGTPTDRAIEHRCACWRAAGYARRVVWQWFPIRFPQAEFREWLDFRGEREQFAAAAPPRVSREEPPRHGAANVRDGGAREGVTI